MEQNDAAPPAPSPKPRPKPKASGRSGVWKWFTDIYVVNEGKNAGRRVVQCVVPKGEDDVCGRVLLFNNSTSSLSGHLNDCHTSLMAQDKV